MTRRDQEFLAQYTPAAPVVGFCGSPSRGRPYRRGAAPIGAKPSRFRCISLFSYAPLAGVKLFVGFIRPEEPLTIEVDEVVWRISHPDLGLPSDLGQVLAHRSAGEECRHEH